MKTKTDFVTNSSSVSYIITMKKDIVESYAKAFEGMQSNETTRISKYLKDFLSEEGTLIYLSNEDIIFKKVTFRNDGDTIDKEFLESEEKELDFSSMSDSDLWSYILGEYIVKGKLSQIEGFGSLQVNTF